MMLMAKWSDDFGVRAPWPAAQMDYGIPILWWLLCDSGGSAKALKDSICKCSE